MTPYLYPNHMLNEHNDDDGWGFYVILDIEESFSNIISLQKQYTRIVSALPTIEEGNEAVETLQEHCTNESKHNHLDKEETRIYLVGMICCLYFWVLLTT